MTFALIACLIVLTAGFLWLLDRNDRRAHAEREAWRALLAADRTAHRDTVADLLQRIQAPEVAVADHSTRGPMIMPKHVPVDDDEAHWEAQAHEDPEVAEALARMEQFEAEQRELTEFEARQA